MSANESALVIVESPSKANTIRKILGENFTIRPTVGHIIDLAKGRGAGIGVDVENGFKPSYKIIADKIDKVKAIVDAARGVDKIYIASDPDREGEAIAFHIASQLEKLNKPIERAEFTEITAAAVKRGIANTRPLNQQLYDAQQARRVLDRIVGFMVSPYVADKFGKGLSAGRVQSVCLQLIVEREKEINNHKAEEYFNISTSLVKKDSKNKFIAKYTEKITNKEKALKIKSDLEKSEFEVLSVKSQEKQKAPLPPLTTSLLQQLGSSCFKISVEKTMSTAQSLYEAGHITYMRTDSTRLSPEAVSAAKDWLTDKGYEFQANTFKNKDASQDGHEAIRPSDINITPDKLPFASDIHKKIYNLIWSRYVSSQMKPALYDTVDAMIKTDTGHLLKSEGKLLKYEGWLVFGGEFIKKEKDVILPKLTKGDNLLLVKPGVKLDEKKTLPPSRFNDGTLVKELERRGIGRPSTYASIIGRITHRNYVKKLAKGYVPTELGSQVAEDLSQFFSFMKYSYTANMESQLDKISQGKLGYEEMLSQFFSSFKKEYQSARGTLGKNVDFSCPKCNAKMVVRHGKFGFFAGCVTYPDCQGRVAIKITEEGTVEKTSRDIVNGVICPLCSKGMFRRDGKFGPFYSCSDWNCKGKKRIPFGKKCPSCGDELYINLLYGEAKLCCMAYPGCTHIENIPKDVVIDWIPPEKIVQPPLDKKIKKVLKY